ncbi:MAG: exodeoxyribonuclease VII large subunit [Chloroflexota bacterium]
MSNIYSVEGVTAYIRGLLERDPPLRDLWVQGEVSNFKAANSGHWYFTVKDKNAALKCVMFRNSASRQSMQPRDGEEIRIHGRISVYDQRGEYQLYADELQPAGGIGDLYQRFEQLKAQLQSEGLFEPERKQALPVFPLRIGVVTSPDAAAFQDVRNVLSRRFPLAEIILSPTLVQGVDAPRLIVKAIERLNAHNACDVILLVRGGGSIEDLWSFNDESVARAIVASDLPIISGVGHETDFTIADFVSDFRAPTPSAAAEVATPQLDDLQANLQRYDFALDKFLADAITSRRSDLSILTRTLNSASPMRYVQDTRQRLDDRTERMTDNLQRQLALLRERLQNRRNAIESASPNALLKRGYAIVTNTADDTPVTTIANLSPDTALTIRLHDGTINTNITDITPNKTENTP